MVSAGLGLVPAAVGGPGHGCVDEVSCLVTEVEQPADLGEVGAVGQDLERVEDQTGRDPPQQRSAGREELLGSCESRGRR